MRIELSGGRIVRVLDVESRGPRWASITIESDWPSVSAVISKITPDELRAIAAECVRVADLLEPVTIAEAA